LDPKLAVSTSTLLDVLVSEIMVSPFLAPETRLSLTKQLLGLSTELHDQVVLKQPLVGRGDDTAQTVIASLIGAVAIGGAAAASAVIGSWVPIVAALAGGVIVFLATSRITRFSLGELTFSLDEPEKSNGKEVAASDHQNAADS